MENSTRYMQRNITIQNYLKMNSVNAAKGASNSYICGKNTVEKEAEKMDI